MTSPSQPSSPSSPLPIVVGIDGSKFARRAAFWAAEEAVSRQVPLRLIYVVEADDPDSDAVAVEAADALRSVTDTLNASGLQVKVETDILQGDPVDVLAEASRSAGLMCLGWKGTHDSGPGRRGSTAALVAQAAECSVAVVHRRHAREAPGPHRWVVAVLDDRPHPRAILQKAIDEASLRDASILALTPWPAESERSEHIRAKIKAYLDERDPDDAGILVCVLPRPGDVTDLLAQSADIDQLVIAQADDPELVAQLVDPVTAAILRGTDCSLLVLRDRA
ncbi:universal stress protein [Mycolicibacterium cosmeticum]|uniref:Universal stress protein UspA-like protein n=1 Tax=Mycolicibacterium cosmeticum TaxID=258533 RepID=W9AZR3_MYCCO|nr:universal stress protein [Mycolicibacterium cosmeticum]TLH74100.1 universal stress protein [Mycolicibacterium cosmeticum]CDO11043.1 universal stress protein UspA-like protein [Mycolicibacterium cosmeticum]